MVKISNAEFVREMKIFWQNSGIDERVQIMEILSDYFNEGSRTESIINKLQESV